MMPVRYQSAVEGSNLPMQVIRGVHRSYLTSPARENPTILQQYISRQYLQPCAWAVHTCCCRPTRTCIRSISFSVRQLFESARLFALGILRRFYWWVATFLLNPWGVYEKFVRDLLPTRFRADWPVGGTWTGYVFVAGLALAAVLTYHELRIERFRAEARARRKQANERSVRLLSRLRSNGINRLFARHVNEQDFMSTWLPRHERWEQVVERHLLRHFGPTHADRFRDLGQLEGKNYVAHGHYNQRMNMLARELQVLEQILDAHTINAIPENSV